MDLFVPLFPSLASGQSVRWDDLIITNGLYFKKFTNVPFSGKVTGKEQGSLKNGKRFGVWIEYNKDGRVDTEVTYKNGKKDTSVTYSYHLNGQLESKITWKDGNKDGPWVFYDEKGQLWSKGEYKNGKEDGRWIYYYDSGQIRLKGTYKDGNRIQHPQGRIIECSKKGV